MQGLTAEQVRELVAFVDERIAVLTAERDKYHNEGQYELATLCKTERAVYAQVRELILRLAHDGRRERPAL